MLLWIFEHSFRLFSPFSRLSSLLPTHSSPLPQPLNHLTPPPSSSRLPPPFYLPLPSYSLLPLPSSYPLFPPLCSYLPPPRFALTPLLSTFFACLLFPFPPSYLHSIPCFAVLTLPLPSFYFLFPPPSSLFHRPSAILSPSAQLSPLPSSTTSLPVTYILRLPSPSSLFHLPRDWRRMPALSPSPVLYQIHARYP